MGLQLISGYLLIELSQYVAWNWIPMLLKRYLIMIYILCPGFWQSDQCRNAAT